MDIAERLIVERDIGCATREAREVMANAANEITRLRSIEKSLRQISRMRVMPDDKINCTTLHAAIEVAKLHFTNL